MALLSCNAITRWLPLHPGGLAAGLLLAIGLADPAAAGSVREYQLKGAFLYNFAKFVQWPTPALAGRADFVICILGESGVESELGEVVKGKSVDGKAVAVQRTSGPHETAGCHILFATQGGGFTAQEIADATSGASVLIVGESRDFARKGGMVNFRSEENRLRFAINKKAAEAAGLAISSHLLKLAHPVYD